MRARWEILYNFNEPSEKSQVNDMLHASDMKCVLWDLDQWLRAKIKYEELPADAYEAYEKSREQLWELLKEYNIKLDE